MTVTLETLKADFEAAAAELQSHYRPDLYSNMSWFVFGQLPDTDAAKTAKARHEMALNVLWVAQTHGLKAATAFKISDGLIDPRVKV